MSKNVKNIELVYENKPVSIAHQRNGRFQDGRNRLQQLNFWKMFTRMPRTNSYSQKQPQQKLQEYLSKQDQKLIVISSFKNTQTTSDSITKNFRLHRQKIKRYISDEDFIQTGKNSENNFKNIQCKSSGVEQQNEEVKEKIDIANLPTFQDENHSDILISKRSVLSSNYSQMKTKQRINRDIGKKIFNVPQRINSKIRLPQLKQQKKYPMLMKDPNQLKDIRSQSYIIVEYPSQRIIISHRSAISLQIASLTKIMTFYTIYTLAIQRNIDITSTYIQVSPKVMHITGTSADLIEGEQYTIQQLLYGLMLPSGNDAANQLAYWGGQLIAYSSDHKILQKTFVAQMNKLAKSLDLKNTKFGNPHGLPHQQARSNANDLAKLCCICMNIDLFRRIVGCKIFRTTVKNGNMRRVVEWQNTNKLLRREGFIGLKTGITVTAGPCLAAAFNFRDKTYISIILRAPKISARFKQTRLLIFWALTKLHKDLNQSQRTALKRLKKNDRQLDSDNSQDEHEFRYDNDGYGEYKRRCNILNYEL